MKNENLKSENDRKFFKKEFKKRMYLWVLKIIKVLDELPKGYVSQVLGKQLLRSSTSVLANYVEADSASSRKDFINFFNHSLKSANETKVWLSLIKDAGKYQGDKIDFLIREVDEISKIIASSIITLKNK